MVACHCALSMPPVAMSTTASQGVHNTGSSSDDNVALAAPAGESKTDSNAEVANAYVAWDAVDRQLLLAPGGRVAVAFVGELSSELPLTRNQFNVLHRAARTNMERVVGVPMSQLLVVSCGGARLDHVAVLLALRFNLPAILVLPRPFANGQFDTSDAIGRLLNAEHHVMSLATRRNTLQDLSRLLARPNTVSYVKLELAARTEAVVWWSQLMITSCVEPFTSPIEEAGAARHQADIRGLRLWNMTVTTTPVRPSAGRAGLLGFVTRPASQSTGPVRRERARARRA